MPVIIQFRDDCELDSIEFSTITDGKQPTFVRREFYNKTDCGRCETESRSPDKTPSTLLCLSHIAYVRIMRIVCDAKIPVIASAPEML